MPGEAVVLGNAFPIYQSVNWNRADPFPGFMDINIVSYAGADSLRFDLTYINTAVKWLKIGGQVDVGYLDPWDTNPVAVDVDFLNDLPNGQYKAAVIFSWTPVEGNDFVLRGEFIINITGTPPNQIATDKNPYNLVYNRSTDELTGDLAVGIVNNDDDIELKFWQNGNIFAAAENFTTGFNLAENPAIPMATNLALPETGSVAIPAKILKQTGEFVSGFNINLVIVDGGITVQPESLYFEVFKGSPEKSAVLNVTNPLGADFQVTEFPEWLILDDVAGNTSQNINVTTETDLLPVGNYTANIKFEFNDDFLLIPVTLDLKAFIIIDETKDFCLDLPPVKVNRKSTDAKFVRITMTAVYKVLGVTSTFEKVYQMPYFLDVASFELGEKLHRHFPRIKDHFFNENNLDLLSKIDSAIKVEELDADRQPIFEQSATGIKLFPGKKPAGYPFLTNYIFRKKNKDSIIFSSLVVADKIEMSKILEKNLSNPLIASIQEIRFWDYPKVFNPVHVQWENQNLVPEWFTFTGDYTISPEFNQVYARSIFNAQNEKYDVTKIKTLNIDTGLILAKERPLIEEMIESKISFIKIGSKVYRCFNITKKMTLESSKEELLSNDLEYLIVEQ